MRSNIPLWIVIPLILVFPSPADANPGLPLSQEGDPASADIMNLGQQRKDPSAWQQWSQQNPTYRQLRINPQRPPFVPKHRPAKKQCTGQVKVVAHDFVAVPDTYLGTTSVTTAYTNHFYDRYETEQQHEYDLAWRPLGKLKNLANCAVTAVSVDFSIRQGPKLADTQTGQLTIRLGPGQVAAFTGTDVTSINNFDPKMIIHSIHWQFEDGTIGHQVR